MKINGNAVRVGHVLNYKDKLYVVTKTMHTQPGKGGAFMQVEMKGLLDGSKLNERFRSSEQVERVHLEEMPFQFLYEEGTDIVLMDAQTYEQIQLPIDLLGDSKAYLQPDMTITVCFYEGKPISVRLPDQVIMEIVEAEPVVKGQTASSSYKPAILENGVRIMVPPHIESGMRVVVSTEGEYIERAKN